MSGGLSVLFEDDEYQPEGWVQHDDGTWSVVLPDGTVVPAAEVPDPERELAAAYIDVDPIDVTDIELQVRGRKMNVLGPGPEGSSHDNWNTQANADDDGQD
ncbi:hypothetical protein [Nocardia puris]|uniref:Uncharacterized protein n=1 Tax=Nocardia puris TaxID=208602 RepID=A0A366DAN6_9NOCA|nr:hypothetical protein [Nocardia puris]RBO87005.1 hypothetical protein DFR74_112182 [Nocardia puris]